MYIISASCIFLPSYFLDFADINLFNETVENFARRLFGFCVTLYNFQELRDLCFVLNRRSKRVLQLLGFHLQIDIFVLASRRGDVICHTEKRRYIRTVRISLRFRIRQIRRVDVKSRPKKKCKIRSRQLRRSELATQRAYNRSLRKTGDRRDIIRTLR